MQLLRTMLVWVLVLCLPVEGMAANLMTHCKDMQGQIAGQETAAKHDHAAMMRQMAEAAAASGQGEHSHHHAMADQGGEAMQAAHDGHEEASGKTHAKKAGCQCGCDCSGNCAVACTTSVASVSAGSEHLTTKQNALRPALVRSQAMAAHRFTPLRPPSAAAL